MFMRSRPEPIADHEDAEGREWNAREGRYIARDGTGVRVPMAMMDRAAPATPEAQRAYARDKLGAAAAGKDDAFLDGAYRGLTGGTTSVPAATPAPAPALTDAQRAYGREGVRRAVADHDARNGTRQPAAMQDKAVRASARDEYVRGLNDAWKGPERAADEAGSRAVADAMGGDPRRAARQVMIDGMLHHRPRIGGAA